MSAEVFELFQNKSFYHTTLDRPTKTAKNFAVWYKGVRHIRYARRCHTISYRHHNSVSPCRPLQIVSRYDIIVILEVVDISGESVKTFLDALNEWVLKTISGNVMRRPTHETKNLVCLLSEVWQEASLHPEDQQSPGTNSLQGAVHVSVQVSLSWFNREGPGIKHPFYFHNKKELTFFPPG